MRRPPLCPARDSTAVSETTRPQAARDPAPALVWSQEASRHGVVPLACTHNSLAELATVARETFEFSIVTWAGRKYEQWVRAWSPRHPRDPGLVQVPESIYRAFQQRVPGQRLNRKEAEALGYPKVPGEKDLARVRQELHEALGRSDWARAHDLDAELRELQQRVAATRMTALRPHSALGL